jgi:DNA-binding MarR family transcriptional regulator
LPRETSLISIAADLDVTPPALYRAIAALEKRGQLARPERGQVRLTLA